MNMKLDWYQKVKSITETLVKIPSISRDPVGENQCGEEIYRQLEQRDSRAALQPERWQTGEGRFNVACLLRGEHPANDGQTIILMCHYDTVDVDEFSDFSKFSIEQTGSKKGAIAFAPDNLRESMRIAWERTDPEEDKHARRDKWLKILAERAPDKFGAEWRWMFGRGCLDMKSGVAAHIAVMQRLWQEREQLAGNVLFLACPDEENESAGILSALPKLVACREAELLTYVGIINADYTAPRVQNDPERYIYMGTVGKLLPCFYILGNPTHVGQPFRGVDAAQIAAELVRRLNLNPLLSDTWPGMGETFGPEVVVPPMTLRIRDLKRSYNVKTSSEAFVYVNWLTLTYSPALALQKMVEEAKAALRTVRGDRQAQYFTFIDKGGNVPPPELFSPRVLTFAELCQQVRQNLSQTTPATTLEAWLQTQLTEIEERVEGLQKAGADKSALDWLLEARLMNKVDSREKSRLLVAALIEKANITRPAIIVFYSPPYYPHLRPQEGKLTEAIKQVLKQLDVESPDSPLNLKFRAAVNDASSIRLRGFYPYISDMSYVGLDETQPIQALIDNMPLFERDYSLNFAEMSQLNCPVVNIGSWGEDAHGLYERVDQPYSFEVVPQLIYETVKESLK